MLPESLVGLSQQLLLAVKSGNDASGFSEALRTASPQALGQQLTTDAHRLAFWINVYNAFAVLSLRNEPELLLRPIARYQHFSRQQIPIAQKQLSLDDIEHGILRHSRVKLSKGYIINPMPGAFEKQHRVHQFDNRIHFALNCGGASCPPIRYYEPENVDSQLQLATEAFLETEAQFDEAQNTLTVSRLFDWYQGDFGGKAGVVDFCRKHGVIPQESAPALHFAEYSWTPELNAFA